MPRSPICEAIAGRRLLQFHYNGATRIVIPCAHGFLSTGNEALRAHEVSALRLGKLWRLDAMDGVALLAEGFASPPPGYRRGDRAMSRIHCQL